MRAPAGAFRTTKRWGRGRAGKLGARSAQPDGRRIHGCGVRSRPCARASRDDHRFHSGMKLFHPGLCIRPGTAPTVQGEEGRSAEATIWHRRHECAGEIRRNTNHPSTGTGRYKARGRARARQGVESVLARPGSRARREGTGGPQETASHTHPPHSTAGPKPKHWPIATAVR